MFYLDKLVLNWIIKKCAELGAIFALGPLEGAAIYASMLGWGIVQAMDIKRGKKK